MHYCLLNRDPADLSFYSSVYSVHETYVQIDMKTWYDNYA